jgi:hypothetical protein
MSRYFFHVHDRGGTVVDPEGQPLEDLASARKHAVTAARQLISEDVLCGAFDLSGYVEITDEIGDTVLIVRFEEAILRLI